MTELEKRIERIEQRLGIPRPDVVFDAGNPYLADFANVHVEDGDEPLKDFVVSLRHSVLTHEQVAERCVAVAKKKGYLFNVDPNFQVHYRYKSRYGNPSHFLASVNGFLSGFLRDNIHPLPKECSIISLEDFEIYCGFRPLVSPNHTLTTLEAFEEYCGVPRQKTRLEWLQELPDGYRERAVANCREWGGGKPSDVCESMSKALFGMCPLEETVEKADFWMRVILHYQKSTPLPPLPEHPESVTTSDPDDPTTLDKPNSFGNHHRFTFSDGSKFVQRELAVGEVVFCIDHLKGEKLELTVVEEDEEDEVYEAGFCFDGSSEYPMLNLPDEGCLFYAKASNIWGKIKQIHESQPHPLTPVDKHEVGKFYLIKDGTDRNHWQSYGLYIGDNKFVHGCLFDGVVCMTASKGATLLEVTKYEEA